MSDLGTLGGTDSEGFGINASGQVTGHSYTSGNGTDRAFLWTSGGNGWSGWLNRYVTVIFVCLTPHSSNVSTRET
jgi:probable HAF family extracellular repeat protein